MICKYRLRFRNSLCRECECYEECLDERVEYSRPEYYDKDDERIESDLEKEEEG